MRAVIPYPRYSISALRRASGISGVCGGEEGELRLRVVVARRPRISVLSRGRPLRNRRRGGRSALSGARAPSGARPLSNLPQRGRGRRGGMDSRFRGNDGSRDGGFESPWRLRDGPSSQSSPVGRRGKTPPAPAARALSQSPPEGERFKEVACGAGPLSVSPRGREVWGRLLQKGRARRATTRGAPTGREVGVREDYAR